MSYDLIIVGMGPAGVSAAIYAKRAGLNVLCIDKAMIGGYLNFIDKIDNYPGLYGISGPDFAFKLYDHIRALNIDFKNEEVQTIVNGPVKKIITNSNEYFSKYIIIATGRVARDLGLDYERELIGKGISHCALCDGAFYKGKNVAVVGGGDSALQEALHLSNICEKVYLIHRNEEFKSNGILVDEVIKRPNVEKIMGAKIVALDKGNDRLSGILLDNGRGLDIDGLFIYVGFVPGTSFAKDLELTDNDGYIIVNNKYETKLDGIYAVGDIIKKDVYQIVNGVSEGALAAINIIEKCK